MNAPRRMLVSRSIDIDDINAQSQNTQQILARWTSTQWRPTVLSFRKPNPAVSNNALIDVIYIKPDRFWRARLWRLYQGNFDAIFYPGLHHRADYWGLRTRFAAGRRIPVIATVEGLPGSTEDSSREAYYSDLAKHDVHCQKFSPSHLARIEWVNGASTHLIAISGFLERMAAARYGNKVSGLCLGIDASGPVKTHWASDGRPRVLCVGNVRAHKRPEFFVELARRFPSADFVWFGEGDARATLAAAAKRAGMTNLSFRGAVLPGELAREYASADIFVLPSKSEGVPKVTQEAARAGLAQVVFGFYEAPTVVDGANGFVVWNDDDFAARLGDLIADPALRERMGRAGQKMMEHGSWDAIAPQWEARIISLIEGTLRGNPLSRSES